MVSAFYDDGHSAVTPAPRSVFPGQDTQNTHTSQVGFLTADGKRDSHAVTLASGDLNGSPRAGLPYPTATWDDISRLVESPSARPKDRARLVVLSSYNAPDGRTHAVQRDRGAFHGLAVDIDKGNPTIDAVVSAVMAVTGGTRAEVYSSSSAAPDKRKWRVLIPLAEPVAGVDYADTQLALFELLGSHGLECDLTLSRAAQPVYLPNVPPERRGEDGQPAFYQYRHLAGPDLALAPDHPILVAREARRATQAAEKEAAQARAEEYKAQRLAYAEATGDDFKPIPHFNDHHSVAEMLARYGFERGHGSHWRHPDTTTGSFATEDRGDHWVCLSAWAHNDNVGRTTRAGNRFGNAFDLFVHFDHRGDRSAAVGAYAAEVRPPRKPDLPADIQISPRLEPVGECRSLDDWRQEVAISRAAAITQPGWHLDRSPTGSGKTHATITALRQASSSLTVLPTHANVVERVEEMRSQGIDAVAYPKLTTDNCQNYAKASEAQTLGLVAGAAVCPGCKFKDECEYRAAVKAAGQAAHRVATQERLRRSSTPAKGIAVVIVDETPEVVVAPSLELPARQVMAVRHLAHGIAHHWYSEADHDQKTFARTLIDVIDTINATCTEIAEPGTMAVDLGNLVRQVPKNWQRLLYDAIGQVGVSRDLTPEALTLVTKAAVGDLKSLEVVTDLVEKGEEKRLHHYLVGTWRPGLPADVPVILLDATGCAADIEAATGMVVNDCTPSGHLPTVGEVVQLVDDITRGTSATTVAGVLEAFLEAHPEVQRLGVMGHKPHIAALFKDEKLSPEARVRVSKCCHFGQGPDRGSNDWHQNCDHILILGTPRANPGTYRRWLAQHGLKGSAARDGSWGSKPWRSVTTDGQPTVVAGAGYNDPDWHRAYVAVTQAGLHQAVGRGRTILAGGCPVTIVSNEPTPYRVGPSLEVRPAALRATVAAVVVLLAPASRPVLSAIENPYREKYGSALVTTAEIVAAVQDATRSAGKPGGVGQSAVEKRLRQCLAEGMLTQPRRGLWGLPAGQPESVQAAAPAVVQPLQPATVVVAVPPESDPDDVQIVITTPLPDVVTETTTTAPLESAPLDFEGLMEAVDERAAILEYDGCHDRGTADRLAREAILGRDAVAGDPSGSAVEVAACVDYAPLHARSLPLVADALKRFPAYVSVLDDRSDPFASSRQVAVQAGACKCGLDKWIEVSIHGGRSTRIDCGHCDRFGWFSRWHGQQMEGTTNRPAKPPALEPPEEPRSLSFGWMPATHTLPTGPLGVP